MQLNALLEVTDYTKPIGDAGDILLFGGQMLLIGLGIVFAVLILLWFSIELFHLLAYTLPQTDGFKSFADKINLTKRIKAALAARRAGEKKAEEPAPAPKKEKMEKKPKTAAPAAPAASDAELIAVLAAAIAASEDAPVGSFRVVSFRRV